MPQWWLHNPHTLLTALTILLITHEICNNLLQSSLLCFRGNPRALDEELQRKFLIQLKDEQILYKWWFTHISLPSFVWSMYMCMLMSWESTCAERMCCANSIKKPLSWFLTIFQFWGSFKDNFSCTRLYIVSQ